MKEREPAMNQRTPVVIVGAGPCGLAAACALWKRGIRARVVEAAAEPGAGSRAILLWPPVLEVLEELGVLGAAEAQGYRPAALCYHTSKRRTIRLPLDGEHGALVLRQDRTCRLLEEELRRLGGAVERPLRVTAVSGGGLGESAVRVTAEDGAGRPLTIEADWLIAADGSRSSVRKLLGIEFEGSDFQRTFALFEGKVAGELARDEAHYYVTPAGVLVAIALPDGEVRLSGALDEHDPAATDAKALGVATIQALLEARGPGGLVASEPSLLTTYGAPHRVAAAMRRGRCFLVGDSAHVHSPAGGQGLTLGMQDVRNLVWKLAGVIDGSLQPAVLDSYEPERRAAAQQVVASIHKLTRQTLFPPMALRARNAVLNLLHLAGKLSGILLPSLAGRLIQYPDVLLGAAVKRRGASLAAAGARRPSWAPAADGRTFRLITGGPAGELARRAAELVAAQPQVAHLHLADRPAGYLLVRPDDYVAASGASAAQLDDDWLRPGRLRPRAGRARRAAGRRPRCSSAVRCGAVR